MHIFHILILVCHSCKPFLKASEAFLNDAVMSNQLEEVLCQVEARRAELAVGVDVLQKKIPENVGYDEKGKVYLR